MRVIVNTTVISNFASIGQLDVLRQLYGSLAMSTDVYDGPCTCTLRINTIGSPVDCHKGKKA